MVLVKQGARSYTWPGRLTRDLDLHSWLKSHDLELSCEALQPETGEEKWQALSLLQTPWAQRRQSVEAIVSDRVLHCSPRELSFDEVTRPQGDSIGRT